jgi:hypothetical protein
MSTSASLAALAVDDVRARLEQLDQAPTGRALRDGPVQPVYFYDRLIEVDIVPLDIMWARRGDHEECAASRACRRLGWTAEIGRHYSWLHADGFVLKLRTSPGLRAAALEWDRGGDFPPGVYALVPVPRCGRGPRRPGAVRGAGGGNPSTFEHGRPVLR